MKTKTIHAYFTLSFFIMSYLFTSCSTVKSDLQVSPSIPGAMGKIKAKPSSDGNTKIDLKVKFLAQPQKVRPDTSTYIVWIRPNEGGGTFNVQNIGALKVDDNLEGKLETVTPFNNFHLFITAENSVQATGPTGEELLWANINLQEND